MTGRVKDLYRPMNIKWDLLERKDFSILQYSTIILYYLVTYFYMHHTLPLYMNHSVV